MMVALAHGTVFAGYRVESMIGRGGMGVVYRATDLSLQRPVALKLIAPELAEDQRFRARFLRESRLAASLDHASVVPIYEAGEQDGQLYLVMRYVEGSDLKTLLRRHGRLEPEAALAILSQVAGALDAAHRRGLVHRDVKPGNILLDRDGHAYLTDFGLTKQLGGASTETGQLVGTLDYLAPEQIRGEAVDGRTDVYGLACVVYECLAGTPPFRRETEAETLWAHMQEEPVPLPDHPALEAILQKGLAKERTERYEGCGELIEATSRAEGVPVSVVRPPPVPPALRRRRRGVLAAGVLVLAGAAATGIFLLTSGAGPRPPPLDNGIASIDPARGGIASFAKAQTAPSNIAVGDGEVWALSTESKTISRIDPESGRIAATFKAGGRPSDIAAGAGALWIGNDGLSSPYHTVSVSRVDPETTEITRTEKLPERRGLSQLPSVGFPQLAVGAGAVWAIDPEPAISRLDPKTGRRVATIATGVIPRTLAAGREGVWFLNEDHPHSLMRIDARKERVGQRISIASDYLAGVAVGAGSVWATSPQDGQLWRIEPGPRPIARSIDVGVGATYVAFGGGKVWTGNYTDGTVSRIDPGTNTVTSKVTVGAPQALAAGAGSGWVSVAAGARNGVLPKSTCSEVTSSGVKPDVLVASDFSLQGPNGVANRGMVDTIRFVLKEHGFRAGRYTVGYQACDDTTAQTGDFEQRKCAANADAYARAASLVAVIGPFYSYCAQAQLAILNQAPGGPLAMISPSASKPNLTRGGGLVDTSWGLRGEPEVYYPTGERSFLRVVARDDLQGTAQAMLAKRLGLRGVYLLDDPAVGGDVTWTDPFRRAASRLGVRVVGSEAYDANATGFRALADRVARSGADGVLIGGAIYSGGDRLLRALRSRLGRRATIMAGDQFGFIPEALGRAGGAARGLYVAVGDLPPAVLDLTPAGRRFAHDFGEGAKGDYAPHAAQAIDVVLHAIARSDGTRASALRELRATRVEDGILGSFQFDRYGDITPAKVAILRVKGNPPPDPDLPSYLRGAVVDRVVTVPARLAG